MLEILKEAKFISDRSILLSILWACPSWIRKVNLVPNAAKLIIVVIDRLPWFLPGLMQLNHYLIFHGSMRSGVSLSQHIPCRFCFIKTTQHIGDGRIGSVSEPSENHVVVTISFNHVSDEGSIFFSCSFDRNSDCTGTILSEHATLKKLRIAWGLDN